MKSIKNLFLLSVLATFFACASLQSVSMTPVPKDRSNPVKVEASRVIFLGFNFDNDYVDRLSEDLRDHCRGGTVSGILTKDEVINYFLFFVVKRKVTASGYCVRG
jgi:hypothetical protein